MVEDPANVARFLAAVGEAAEVPRRSPGRGPPYGKSRLLRGRLSVRRTTVRASGCRRPRSLPARERGTGHGAAEPAH
jgi:hypothetical protein